MSDPSFFGYGSLVNLATHEYVNPRRAVLKGWRRVWKQAGDRPVAFLSIHRAPGHDIQGIVADVPNGDWTALDEREHAYVRIDVSRQLGEETAVYQADPTKTAPDNTGHPILLSYLDVVVQGFFQQYGETGVEAFFATTDGWSVVKDDRADPVYPRFQSLSDSERALTDYFVSALDGKADVSALPAQRELPL